MFCSRPSAARLRARALVAALACGTAAALSLATTAPASTAAPGPTTTAGPTTATGEACLSAPADHRVRTGGTGADPNEVSRVQSLTAQRSVDTRVRSVGLADRARATSSRHQVTVDVHVHVITKKNGTTGKVKRSQITRQIDVLNRAYAGRSSSATAPTVFRFALRSVDYTANSDWYSWSVEGDTDDRDAKRKLRRGDFGDLNLYLAHLDDDILGYATFPWETSLASDGVVLLNDSLPGGPAEGFNRGDTAVHEVGHWLGLFHTFQGGCTLPGDQVADTPAQADGANVFSCQASLDTCPAAGRDPVHNFMSYGDDPCLDRFTAGQSLRMALVWYAFRGGPVLQP